MAGNKDLRNANRAKKDEFYTMLTTIEKETVFHRKSFENQVIFCNCDDPEYSNFWKYFFLNFDYLGLKKLVASHYHPVSSTYKIEYDGQNVVKTGLKENGDFRSEECIEILKETDIVVTNPPFSLFREYVAQLMAYNKKFLIIGNINALTYKETFGYVKENKMWLGASIHSGDREFRVPDDYPIKAAGFRIDENGNKYIRIKGVRWYTNLDYSARHEEFIPYKTYKGNEDYYPKYYNFDAINVNVTKEIPADYDGYMGVPITFMDKYNPDQFEIIGLGIATSGIEIGVRPYTKEHKDYRINVQKRAAVDGDLYLLKNGVVEVPYARIIIKWKR